MGSGAGFDLVAQDEVGAGVTSSGGGEVLAQLCDSGGGAPGRQGVQADGQDTVVGVDVAAAGQRLTGQGECFAVGAGAPGVDADGPGEGGGGVERGDANRVGDELGLYVQDSDLRK